MILKGSQRGGAGALARHLLRTDENEHVTVAEIRGFMSNDVEGALAEAEAIANGTKCKQYLFSLSLNPPKDGGATRDDLEKAADEAEKKLGLTGCPRVLIIHEKDGRRHAHAVWSRIDPVELKAVNLPFFKTRLAELSKDLYIEHDWEVPAGHKEKGQSNPLNFELAEWQQSKRLGLDPRALKQIFQDAWKHSTDLKSFKAALSEHGFYLARGDRRGFVAVDIHNKVFSVSRLTGVKPRDLAARLGPPENLPVLDAVRLGDKFMPTPVELAAIREQRRRHRRELAPLRWARRKIVRAQRIERVETRDIQRSVARSQKLAMPTTSKGKTSSGVPQHLRGRNSPTGVRRITIDDWKQGAVQHLTGQMPHIRAQYANESFDAYLRYRQQIERQYEAQLDELRALQRQIEKARARQQAERLALNARIAMARRLQRDGERNAREIRPGQLEMEF